ncbi:MAG: HAD-IA family hydrolase [Giesbergeria sp.]|jgi:N-acetyl-D-muramate 6-phosphate phosphatase|nr:HAD-IA family hydrolase [Giesbergeria sp.]MBP6158257.1 HAD-IA family hydrolase [Giesbergeria sp.]MBP7082219.1 HAD-IA family hydrolase [Giesbergeria sp.]MBP9783256.1 HAD-IA family hydrolase [Giesbergeria sp.]MBP9894137.1 HAD-IA family hydrolase [Giesbergeria sp.]
MFEGNRAVLFDLDGTLVDSATDLGRAADKMRTDRGLEPRPLAQYRAMAGAGARGMLGIAFGIAPGDPDFDLLREEFFSNYTACMFDHTAAFDEVTDLIAALDARGLRWGVVTNKAARFTEPLLRALPVFASCAVAVSGDTTPHAKPHPEPLFEAARRLGIAPGQCIYVGDDERDIVAGRAAGMVTVAANYGYLGSEASVKAWRADAEINSPLQLLQFLPGGLI